MLLLMGYIHSTRFAFPIQNVVEVVARPLLESIPNAAYYVAGSFVHRGHITPVIDLGMLTTTGTARSLWSSRVIVLSCGDAQQERRVGILVDRAHAELVSEDKVLEESKQRAKIWEWGTTLLDDHGTYCLLDMAIILSPARTAELFPTAR
jgi:chemotaxis signal transduction protein